MHLEITRRAAGSLACALIAIKSFILVTVDGHAYINSGWVCILFGFMLALPFILLLDKKTICAYVISKPICILFSIAMAYEAAYIMRITINSISYSDLHSIPTLIVTSVSLFISIYAVCKNGNGIGNAAKLISLIFMLLFAVIAIVNLNDMNLKWLSPIISPGIKNTVSGIISVAGSILGGAAILITTDENDNQDHVYLRSAAIGSFVALLLSLYWGVMTPPQISSHDRLTSIGRLLANGRSSLAIQLPISFLWFLYIVLGMCGYSFAASILLQKCFRGLSRKFCALVGVSFVFVLGYSGFAEQSYSIIYSRLSFVIYGIGLCVVLLMSKFLRRRQYNA